MLRCRPRVALSPSASPRLHPRASRAIKSKTAARKRRPITKSGSNLFAEALTCTKAKILWDLSESESAPFEVEKRSEPQNVAEAQKLPKDGQADNRIHSLGSHGSLSTGPKADMKKRKKSRQQKIEAARIEFQSSYGRPVAEIALSNSTPSSKQIDSKAGCDFITSFTIDAAQSIYIPG
jgi:hypothetical protein